MSGVLNLMLVVSEAAAPAEPWEGRGDAPSLLPPLCPVPSRGLRVMLAARSAPLGAHGPLGWSGGGVPLPVQGHFPFLRAVATITATFLRATTAISGMGNKVTCNSRRCWRNGRESCSASKAELNTVLKRVTAPMEKKEE